MNDVLSMYRVIQAEHAALVAELEERERRRGRSNARRSRRRTFSNVLGRLGHPRRVGRTEAAST